MKNWKTTLCGVIVLVGTLLPQFFGDHHELVKLGGFLAALGTGLGFVLCKDHDNDDISGGDNPQPVPILPAVLTPRPTGLSGAMTPLLAGILAPLLLFTGCGTLQKNPNAAERIADHVAYDVTVLLLTKHPEWSRAFQSADLELAALESQPTIDAVAVVEILQRLPVKEFATPTARIIFDGVTLVIELTGDPQLKPESEAELRKVVRGLRSGIRRAIPVTLSRGLPPVPRPGSVVMQTLSVWNPPP